jgi:type IV secretion system protein VirD4
MSQDLSQLKSLYKERWETFIGNAGAVAAFAPNDNTMASWLATKLGDTSCYCYLDRL